MATQVGIGLVGPGAIGKTFLTQLHRQRGSLLREYSVDVKTLGIIGSKKMLLSSEGIDLEHWQKEYSQKAVDADLKKFYEEMKECKTVKNYVFVDSTATDEVPQHYTKWFDNGCHVVTPNKKFGSGDLARYKKARELCKMNKSHFFYEATVGAGLPVISTLQSLLYTGDQVEKIEGVFSGTLSYIFNQVSKDLPFSTVVKKAKELGFTEPDPRDDLAGMDVARKVIVLARECGVDIELKDLELESLVPKELESISDVDTFLKDLHKFDDGILNLVSKAESSNQVLRYVGVVNVKEKKCEVGLKTYPLDHALAGLKGTDNMIIFKTARYPDQPLVIQGPGAGAEVTAMGVFSDFLSLIKQLK